MKKGDLRANPHAGPDGYLAGDALPPVSCVAELRGRMTRPMNDMIAMETSMLFMEEFMRRAAAPAETLLEGAWPRHPFDDAVIRLSTFFAARFSAAGAFRRMAEELEPIAETLLGHARDADVDARRLAERAIYESAAEAIGGTSRAWANDAGELAADFTPIEQTFAEAECHAFDKCGGVVCCLNFATFLFRQRRAAVSSTPGRDAPFMWTRCDYEGFAESVGARVLAPRSRAAASTQALRDFARASGMERLAWSDALIEFVETCSSNGLRAAFGQVPGMREDGFVRFSAIVSCLPGDMLLSPCLYRDPFALALEIAAAFDVDFGGVLASAMADPSVRSSTGFRARMGALSVLTFACCAGTGREDANAYWPRRCSGDFESGSDS